MSTTKLLDPTYDYIFKTIMLDKENEKYLKKLISLITNIDINCLENMHIENIEHNIKNVKDKRLKSDIIITAGKYIINLEMNRDYYEGIIEKNSMYMHKIMADQMMVGDKYKDIKTVIQINFDNYSKFEGEKAVYRFVMQEEETKEVLSKKFKEYHVDLAYIRKKCYDKKEINLLERYCMPLVIEKIEELEEKVKGDEILESLAMKMTRLLEEEKILGLYDAEKQEKMVKDAQIEYATKLGKKEGEKMGLQRGQKIVIENMLKQGLDCNTISKYTNISIDDINEILK